MKFSQEEQPRGQYKFPKNGIGNQWLDLNGAANIGRKPVFLSCFTPECELRTNCMANRNPHLHQNMQFKTKMSDFRQKDHLARGKNRSVQSDISPFGRIAGEQALTTGRDAF